jgi:alkylation response protein AidB-like acyl-CoA dehydrogenase
MGVMIPELTVDTAPGSVWPAGLIDDAEAAGEDITASLALARSYGSMLPLPGDGETDRRFRTLAALGEANLTAARVFEAHTDALAILAQAGVDEDDAPGVTYGVFAAEGPGDPLRAEVRGDDCPAAGRQDDRFRLTGTKHWCSLGSRLDAALVTARVPGGRRLFRVDLHDPSVSAAPTSAWVARGLRTVTSTSLRFDYTPARAVGETDWYLKRPGFSWGGIGVAACWYGGALALQKSLSDAANPLNEPLSALSLGRIDALLYAAGAVLTQAAALIDSGRATGTDGELLALRTRAVIADAAEQTLREVGHALGPGPLAFNEEHARRVADLTLYIRQHHGERDLAALGRAITGAER